MCIQLLPAVGCQVLLAALQWGSEGWGGSKRGCGSSEGGNIRENAGMLGYMIYVYTYIYIYDICVLLNLMCKTSYKQPSCPYIPFSNLFSKIDARSDTLTLCIGWLMEIWWLHPSGRLPMCAPPKLSVLLAMFGDAGTGRDGATPWCQAWDVDPSFRSLR